MRKQSLVAISAGLALSVLVTASASAQPSFYEGKTVSVIIGATGGSLELAARIVTRHLGKHIPGKPNVVLQNMPGAAHLVATNHVYTVAKPDGLTLLAANPSVGIAQLTKVDAVRFDLRKFEWLGSSGADGVAMAIRPDLPYKNWQELKSSGQEIVVGTTGPGSNAHDFPLFLKEFAGAKFKLVSGYKANADILLALERKEVDAWAAFATTIKLAADRGAVRPIVRGRVAIPGFESLPVDEDLATSPLGKAMMGIRAAPLTIGRAFAAPPGTPADRMAMLRDAFARTAKDPEFLAEMKKAKISTGYISAEEVARLFAAMLEQPPEVQKELVKYIKFGS
ncbi:MAG TPA: tripartite tricarboxylate transporter substrate-binding protein [Burkholderiales bacterium]|nr:tripartite tricarboxylate transporter substrate-binding protein [Burkholderiales bacterium]